MISARDGVPRMRGGMVLESGVRRTMEYAMEYKGEGLALRTPRDGSSLRPGRRTGRGSSRSRDSQTNGRGGERAWLGRALAGADDDDALWVDDAVLQTFNQAYDLALAHRAREIGLAHLIHALTLVEPAVDRLHSYNFHVSTLRRESAAVIAGEMPPGRVAAAGEPLPSDDLVELLELAAERAYNRRSPVTTEDILETLLDMKRDPNSRNLLSRHRHDWDLRASGEPEPRERVRVSAGSHHIGPNLGSRGDTLPTTTDSVQNTRIDLLERAVRELSEDLSLNRKSFAAMMDELRQDRAAAGQGLYVNNGAAPAYPEPAAETLELDHDHIIDRLYLIERNVNAKFTELQRTWTLLGQRLEVLEDGLAGRTEDGGALEKLASVPDRLAAIEARLESGVAGSGGAEAVAKLEPALTALPQRLEAMEHRLLSRSEGAGAMPADLGDKLGRIDSAFAALLSRLDDLERRFDTPISADLDVAPLSASLKDIEERAGDTQLMIDAIDDRVQKLDGYLDAQRSQLAQMSSTLGTEIKAIASAVSAQGVGGERMQGLIHDGMRGVAQTFEQQKGEIAQSVTREISERLGNLATMLQGKFGEQQQVLSGLSNRIAALESADDSAVTGRLGVMAEAHERDSQTTHDALLKINANQQTLASTLDQWRGETRQDFHTLNSRIGGLEASRQVPSAEFQELRARLDEMGTALKAREMDGWTRFRIWLYGTDDWYGASWGDRAGR